MKRFTLTLLSTLLIGLLPAVDGNAASSAQSTHTDALCLPGVYLTPPQDCLLQGPSAYLTRQAQSGISLPLRPLQAFSPDTNLAYIPFRYARVNTPYAAVFSTQEDAVAEVNSIRSIEPGLGFITYLDIYVVDGWKYYLIGPGEWMRGEDLNAGIATSTFMGLEFYATPERKFGWMLFPQESQRTPGHGSANPSGHKYTRFDIIQVYETITIDGVDWHLIAPDEWIEARHAALVYPANEPPVGVTNGRWIEVNLFEQTISVYENNQLVFATLTSSGVPGWWTRPGLFQIQEKLASTRMTGSFEADRSDYYYLEDVPWTMYFDEARAFHGAYWHNQYGYERSHGCANLSPGDSQWLYNWAQVGDFVYIWDPSGITPEDPALYGSGGA